MYYHPAFWTKQWNLLPMLYNIVWCCCCPMPHAAYAGRYSAANAGLPIGPKNRAKTRIRAIWLKWPELDPNFKLWPEKDENFIKFGFNDPNLTRKTRFGLMQMIFIWSDKYMSHSVIHEWCECSPNFARFLYWWPEKGPNFGLKWPENGPNFQFWPTRISEMVIGSPVIEVLTEIFWESHRVPRK